VVRHGLRIDVDLRNVVGTRLGGDEEYRMVDDRAVGVSPSTRQVELVAAGLTGAKLGSRCMSEPHEGRSAGGGGGSPPETARLLDELEESRKEVLRLRDLVIGREAELGTARGRIEDLTAQLQRFQRYANVESRLDTVLRSGSRQAARGLRASLRALRRRKA
jgi:hypothetical protein